MTDRYSVKTMARASIREFGFTNPVLIDEEDGIIAGHGRVLAAHLLGLDEVPCIVLAHLTPTQRRAYVLADNKLALNAGWDLEMLSLEIGELGEAGFDLSLTGFDEFELGELFARGHKVGPIPTMRRSHPRTRSRSRATYGCSAAIDCSAATAQRRPTLSACSVASRRTLWSPTRPTALITTRLGAIRPADRLMGRPGGLRPAR